jgi:uncharacterized protein (TIGR02145 family)
MAENLNYAGAGTCYNNSPDSCAKYGRLYDWAAAMEFDSRCNTSSCTDLVQSPHQGVCPEGWHVPSNAEWTTLVNFVGGSSTAGTKLKSARGWNDGSGYIPGTDDFGFSALPGGYHYVRYSNAGEFGMWWSTTVNAASSAYHRTMWYDRENVLSNSHIKGTGRSLRCIKD